MGVKLKVCNVCRQRKHIGGTKKSCKNCRNNPLEKIQRPVRLGPRISAQGGLDKKQRLQVLKNYGFLNYMDYLKSDLWKEIRSRVLQGAKCACGCGKWANQAHHRIYTESNLTGKNLEGLVALHGDCHYTIEFTEERKASLSEANSKLKSLQKRNKRMGFRGRLEEAERILKQVPLMRCKEDMDKVVLEINTYFSRKDS